MSDATDGRFNQWMSHLESRHLADLTFQEVSRSLRALSSTYVERRARIASGAALTGTGKRAAFALFYGPLHFLLIRHIVNALPGTAGVPTVVDLGCGTGAAGAAWGSVSAHSRQIIGIDRHPWAIDESRRTYRDFDLSAQMRTGDLTRAKWPKPSVVLAAFSVNELDTDSRDRLLPRLAAHAEEGGRVLIVEPVAGFVAPWWGSWHRVFEGAGGRADEWRVRVPLPPIVEKLDRAAGLNHRELTARTLWL